MYLTFLTEATVEQMTFEKLLQNPYITFDEIPRIPQKKVTVEITDEYAADLYSRRMKPDLLPDMKLYLALNPNNEYRHFTIPKKSDPHKRRHIDAPSEILSMGQAIYKAYIEDQLKVLPHKAAYAYVRQRSIVSNNEKHIKNKSKWYVHFDLKDFFNSIDEKFLRKMLMQIYPFPFISKEHFDGIIKLSLLRGVLPQGSKLSPTLTNIIMVPIDHEITETLHNYKKHHYVYTRYADDITISCKEKFDWKEIQHVVKRIFEKWEVPFNFNDSKTRFTSVNGKNYHCGLNINYDKSKDEFKLSAGHEKNNKLKAKLFNFCTAGEFWSVQDVQKMLGLLSYYRSFEPEYVNKILKKYNEKFNTDIEKRAKSIISI